MGRRGKVGGRGEIMSRRMRGRGGAGRGEELQMIKQLWNVTFIKPPN
jgi:hypothetical protein